MVIKGLVPVAGLLLPMAVTYSDGIIRSLERIDEYGLPFLLPGFIDVHTHGGGGLDVNHIEGRKEIEKLSLFYAEHGVTSFHLSVMTDELDRMLNLSSIIGKECGKTLSGAELVGIHLEGPFLSTEYNGCMPERLILEPDTTILDKFLEVSGGNIRYITIAPERNGSLDFIRYAVEKGVVVSMGHSSAEYEEAVEAVNAGVTSATHLFNAMKLFHMHRPAVSGAALESDKVYTEIISDGFHLHPVAVRLVIKTKGLDKVVLITDSIMAAGMGDGEYSLGVNRVIVKDGDAKTPDGVRAGSTLTLDRALRNVVSFTSLSLERVWRMTSFNQAEMLSMDDRGKIEVGRRADFVLLDNKLEVLETIVRGRTVYRKGER